MVKAGVKFVAVGLCWFAVLSVPVTGRPTFSHVSEFIHKNTALMETYELIKAGSEKVLDVAASKVASLLPEKSSG